MPDSIRALKTALRSEFATDAEFRELLEVFVAALPERCRLLAELHRAGSIEELGRQAHQLKGAGGGYGFPEISAAGARLQDACRERDTATVDARVADLLELLGRAEA